MNMLFKESHDYDYMYKIQNLISYELLRIIGSESNNHGFINKE